VGTEGVRGLDDGVRRADELKEWQGNGTTGKELRLASPRSRVGSPRSVGGSSSSSSSDAEVKDGDKGSIADSGLLPESNVDIVKIGCLCGFVRCGI